MSVFASPSHKFPALLIPRERSNARRMRRMLLLGVLAGLLLVPAADAHTLTKAKAIRAIQKKADAYAGKRTKLMALTRFNRHAFLGGVEWQKTEQVVCKVGIYVRFRSRRSHRLVYRFRDLTCESFGDEEVDPA